MVVKVSTVNSENLSVRKRKACDHPIKEPRYCFHIFRYLISSDDHKPAKRNEMVEVWSKLFKRRKKGAIEIVHWRTSDVTILCK